MAKFIDFSVKWDESTESETVLFERILYALFVNRIKNKKPVFAGIFGESGEGKSESTLTIMDKLAEMQGYDFLSVLPDTNIITPFEYADKMNNLLFDVEKTGRLKKVNMMVMHEARDLVRATQWSSFLNQTVGDVNTQSRQVKRIMFFILSQFVKDVSKTIRNTLTYYINVYRPEGRNAQFTIYRLYKDDTDIENPKLRRRKVKGWVVSNKGTKRLFQPSYFEIPRPRKEIIHKFIELDKEGKTDMLRQKLEKLVQEMKIENGIADDRLKYIAKYYTKHSNEISLIGKTGKRGFKLEKEARLMLNLTETESQKFEKILWDEMKKKGMSPNIKDEVNIPDLDDLNDEYDEND